VCTLRIRNRAALAGVAALSAAGCFGKSPEEVGTSTIVVHAVLNAAQDTQVVSVQRTTAGEPLANPVDSAVVTITGPDGAVMTATESTDAVLGRVYRISLAASHEQLAPGATYGLRVRLRTGEEITGTTTVPSAVPSAQPSPVVAFDETTDTLRLNWTAVAGARSYEIRVQSTAGVYVTYADTNAAALPGNLRALEGKIVFTAGLDHQVIVSAVDAAYDRYYRTNSDEFTGTRVQGNLSGAEGLFGSIVILKVVSLHVTATVH
jgi:hypothetical protein